MPDYGDRANDTTFLVAGTPPYGWTGAKAYSDTDARLLPKGYTVLSESMDWGQFKARETFSGTVNPFWSSRDTKFGAADLSNPPFLGIGSALPADGHIPSWMKTKDGGTIKRILRGYVRHADVASYTNLASGASYTGDDLRTALQYNTRLFFMYNPAQIERRYMAFGDTAEFTDPGDVAGTQDLVAPQMVNIGFSLFFDRQTEVATVTNHPGCLLDLQTFDALVRGGSVGHSWFDGNEWHYDTSNVTENTSLMINSARPITVVFSPNLAFTGQIMEASASFEKFSHRMIPLWMTLNITMKLLNISASTWAGPNAASGGTIDVVAEIKAKQEAQAQAQANAVHNLLTGFGVSEKIDSILKGINGAGGEARTQALTWARKQVGKPYDKPGRLIGMSGDNANDSGPGSHFDCSSLVCRAFRAIGWGMQLKVWDIPDTASMWDILRNNKAWESITVYMGSGLIDKGNAAKVKTWLQPGDIALRTPGQRTGHPTGHVVMIDTVGDDSAGIIYVHAPGPGKVVERVSGSWDYAFSNYSIFGRAKGTQIDVAPADRGVGPR